MNRRQYLTRTGVPLATLAAMAGCLDDLPGNDSSGDSVPVADRTGDRELDRAVGELNEAALALFAADDDVKPSEIEFDPSEPTDRIESARAHLEAAADELDDDRESEIELLRTYAAVLERLVDVTGTVTDETLEADFEAAFAAIGDDDADGDEGGDDDGTDADENLDGDTDDGDGDSVDADAGSGDDGIDSDDESVDDRSDGDDGETDADDDLAEASATIDERTDEFAVAETNHAAAAADVESFDEAFERLVRIEPAELADGVATLGDATASLVTLGGGTESLLDGYERLQAGRDHMEREAYGEAETAFDDAGSTLETATATFREDEEPPGGIAEHVETAICQSERLTDAAAAFEEWAIAAADGDRETARSHRDAGERALDATGDCT